MGPAAKSKGFCSGSFIREIGISSDADLPGKGMLLLGYIFAVAGQDDRHLSTGSLALGAEGGAVAGAVDDSSAHGPLHGGDGILTEIRHIRIG